MAKVSQEEYDKMKIDSSRRIEEVAPGVFKGPWLPDLYDNRTECWRENMEFLEKKERREAGQNESGRTVEEEKVYQQKRKVQLEKKRQSELLEQAALKAAR